MQNGPRTLDAVIASRYWLTPAGWAAAEQAQQTLAGDEREDSE